MKTVKKSIVVTTATVIGIDADNVTFEANYDIIGKARSNKAILKALKDRANDENVELIYVKEKHTHKVIYECELNAFLGIAKVANAD